MSAEQSRHLIVVSPHGFCAGVARAIETVEAALHRFGPPLYCLNEIVHNRQVVDGLRERGVTFVKSPAEVPRDATLLLSAHGVAPAVKDEARARGLRLVDATCPFVSKVHSEVRKYAERGYTIFLIGHRGHEEIVGVRGEAPDHVMIIQNEEDARTVSPVGRERVAAVTQTTLSADLTERIVGVLRERFPALETPPQADICYATENRQNAVRALAGMVDLIIVLGSPNSSNSRRLVEVAASAGCSAMLVSSLDDVAALPLADVRALGITSGASSPESFLHSVVARLADAGFTEVNQKTAADERPRRFGIPCLDGS